MSRPVLHRRQYPRLTRDEEAELNTLIHKMVDSYDCRPGAVRRELSPAEVKRYWELCDKSWRKLPKVERTKPIAWHKFTGCPGRKFSQGE